MDIFRFCIHDHESIVQCSVRLLCDWSIQAVLSFDYVRLHWHLRHSVSLQPEVNQKSICTCIECFFYDNLSKSYALFCMATKRKTKSRQEGALVSVFPSCSLRVAVLYVPTCYTGLVCMFTFCGGKNISAFINVNHACECLEIFLEPKEGLPICESSFLAYRPQTAFLVEKRARSSCSAYQFHEEGFQHPLKIGLNT